MRSLRHVKVLVLCSLITGTCCIPASLQAATANADMIDESSYSEIWVNGTNTLYAYSQLAVPAVGPNATTTHTINNASAPAVGVVAGASITSYHGLLLTKYVYSPVVGVTGVAKAVLPAGQTSGGERVSSSSSAPQGEAYAAAAYNTHSAFYLSDNMLSTATLTARPGNTVVGASAAYANDPETIPTPGTYSYDPMVDGSLVLDDPSQTGGISWFAVDSRETNLASWEANGQPASDTLWELTISASGIPQSPSDLTVNFYLNPQDASLGILSTSYTQSQIQANVLNAVTVSNGVVTLNSMSLFDPGAQYFVPSGSSTAVQYDYGDVGDVAGSTTTIPEPSSLVLLSVGVLGLLRKRCR